MKKWYPGHINEAKRNLLDNLSLCDTVIEVVDARAPFASKNRELEVLTKDKNRVLVINKSDLIDSRIAINMESHFKKTYKNVVSMSAKEEQNVKRLFYILDGIFKRKKEKMARRGVNAFPIRAIVLGVPNVGKSKIINALTGRNMAPVADRPGETKGKKWIRILPNVDLLDTPGILWMNANENELKKLVLIGSLKDNPQNLMGAALHLIEIISANKLSKLYGIEQSEGLIEAIMKKFDLGEQEVYNKIVDDFRKGRLGSLSLESA